VQVLGLRLDILELNGDSRIYVVPHDRSTPPLSHRVSPDGRYLVGISIDSEDVTGVGLDGRLLWQAPNTRAGQTAINADGTRLVTISRTDSTLAIYEVSTGLVRTLDFAGNHAVWAPRGDRLAYDDGANLRIHDLASNATIDHGPGTEPSWLSDGNDVAVRVGSKVELVHLSTGERRALFADARDRSMPRWSPDGEWMTYRRRGGRDERIDWTGSEPSQVMLRHLATGAEASITEIYKANPGDYTWTTNAELCRRTARNR
jgi:hypothetical protein